MNAKAAAHAGVGAGRENLSAKKPLRVRLIVISGRSQGNGFEIPGPKFLIGRSPECHLRPNNPLVSRVHASIEQRDGRVFLRDQGTTNGTRVGEKTLRGTEAEVRDGDLIQIGPLHFRLAIEGQVAYTLAGAAEPETGQILDAGGDDLDASTEVFILKSFEASSQTISVQDASQQAATKSLSTAYLSYAVMQNTLVVTVIPHELNELASIDPIRYGLSFTLEMPLPRHLVLDMSRVDRISQRALVMLLAQARRFEKAGGSLRLCHLAPEVAAFIDQVRPPVPIDCHGTVDEAIAARG